LNLLPHETIDFETYAEDDFGVNSVNLRLNSLTRITETKKLLVSTGSPKASKITSDFVFNPEVLGLIPDSYELIAEAVDYYPDREYSGSEPITVHLLSYENHASLVKSQFTALIDNLDEYYQHALSLHHENQLLDRMLTKAPHDYELTNRMNEAVTKERKAIKLFNSVATPVQDLAKDAFRNHELDRSIQLALTLLSQSLLNEFPEKLNEETSYYQKAADNRFSAQVRQTYQAQGISIEKQTLADLRKLLNEMREFDRKFEASNFIQRLQSLSKSHDDRAQQMLRNYDKFMGNTPSELDPALQQFNIDYANLQISDLQTLRWIEDDMRNYASYAEKPVFNTLADKISDSGVYVQMRKTNEMLLSNRRYISIILTQEWAELIKAWAEELSSEVTGSGGSGGGAGGASQPEQDAEFMLRIMEIIREQQNVRGKTRALDQHKKLLKPNE